MWVRDRYQAGKKASHWSSQVILSSHWSDNGEPRGAPHAAGRPLRDLRQDQPHPPRLEDAPQASPQHHALLTSYQPKITPPSVFYTHSCGKDVVSVPCRVK